MTNSFSFVNDSTSSSLDQDNSETSNGHRIANRSPRWLVLVLLLCAAFLPATAIAQVNQAQPPAPHLLTPEGGELFDNASRGGRDKREWQFSWSFVDVAPKT